MLAIARSDFIVGGWIMTMRPLYNFMGASWL